MKNSIVESNAAIKGLIYTLIASHPLMLQIAIEPTAVHQILTFRYETQCNRQGRKGGKYHVMSNAEVVKRGNGNYSMN